PRNPSRSKKRLLKTALRDNYLEKRRSEESCFNQPKVIRALFIAKQSLEASIISEKRKSDLPENAGKPWKPDEDELLENSFDSGLGVDELSRIHKRTKGSIASRLVRLGKINERSDIYTR
ncbi:hypothetical protein, partial [Aeromonas veronii]|uniref:hypothetical protein n=1 Tax=Aeromonas veronii TaxID=654 RepID=UPI001FD55E64